MKRRLHRTTDRDWRRIARLMLELYAIEEEHARIRKELGMEVVVMRERGIDPPPPRKRRRPTKKLKPSRKSRGHYSMAGPR